MDNCALSRKDLLKCEEIFFLKKEVEGEIAVGEVQHKSVQSQAARTGWSEQVVYGFFPVQKLEALKDLGSGSLEQLKGPYFFWKHLIDL